MTEYTDAELEAFWKRFGDVPVDRGYIDEDWLHFTKGTPVLDVWHWFDRAHSQGVVAGCMNLEEPSILTPPEFVARLPMSADEITQLHVEQPDVYITRIINAAFVMVAQGRGHYVYKTSWSSGATHWSHGAEHTVVPAPILE